MLLQITHAPRSRRNFEEPAVSLDKKSYHCGAPHENSMKYTTRTVVLCADESNPDLFVGRSHGGGELGSLLHRLVFDLVSVGRDGGRDDGVVHGLGG